jgi:hypothetical protein
VVVMPACLRRRSDPDCRADRTATELRCTHCTAGCAVSAVTRVAEREGAAAIAVVHGSDFSRFLRSPALSGTRVGLVGVACVPGLVGAGWRARAAGLAAQSVLLESSGCAHWRNEARPTRLDLRALRRVVHVDRAVRAAA